MGLHYTATFIMARIKTTFAAIAPWLLITNILPYGTPHSTPAAMAESGSLARASAPSTILKQGKQITLNGRQLTIPWIQTQHQNNLHFGISDTAAEKILGIELLSSNNPASQPIAWFDHPPSAPLTLKTEQLGAYRYLDITKIAQLAGWQIQIMEDTLKINSPQANIQNISLLTTPISEEIIVYLDRPTPWQMSQGKKKGIIKIDAMADPALLQRFAPPSGVFPPGEVVQEKNIPSPPLLVLAAEGKQTIMRFNLPEGRGTPWAGRQRQLRRQGRLLRKRKASQLRVRSSQVGLIIEVRPDTLIERDIVWGRGINWHQRFISIEDEIFPVTWLEVDPRVRNITMKPITTSPERAEGIAPLITTARKNEAAIAINGGFFNRNNQLPLGAVRQNGTWLSGPILNRGAIAWNDLEEIKFDRLSLEEVLTTSTNASFPIQHLNSGYIKAGISRYTPAWDDTYKTMTDNEIIVVVRNHLIVEQFQGDAAGSESFPIPSDGYLLVLRSYQSAASQLEIGTIVNLENRTIPPDFARYSHIMGAGPLLMQNGIIVLDAEGEKFSTAFQQQGAPRSAIAKTFQNTLIIVAVHNRPGGKGPTLEELALIMEQMGAIDALNLDGGSSTSLYLGGQLINRSPATAARVHNGLGLFIE